MVMLVMMGLIDYDYKGWLEMVVDYGYLMVMIMGNGHR